jgi:TatD DNase family protein
MDLVDIGVNFHAAQLRGLGPELLERGRAAGVVQVLATGTSLEASRAALAVARSDAGVFATAGVHPHGASALDDAGLAELESLWGQERVVAVGECGLDYDRMFSPKEAQRRAFALQLEAAVRRGLPLFLHCRAAFDDFHAMLREAAAAGARGVAHCFTDGPAEAEALLALGFDLGITGWLTDTARGGALREALRVIPLARLHLETDAPWLRPKNARGTRPYNEPALLPWIARAAAGILGLPEDALAAQASATSRRLFGLPVPLVAQGGTPG